jgi:predicted O-linked N-acetylglucosamine transferase (SPINDLY family)
MNSPQKQKQKPGRNEPCPCGNGKKYKQCCMQRDEASAKALSNEEISLSQSLQLALSHHQAGRLPQAEAAYRQILSIIPEHADALHLSGVLAYQKGESDTAAELISKAISADPAVADYYNHLGLALRAQGKPDAAIANYRQALLIRPDYAEAHNNMGAAFENQGSLDAAIGCYRKALAVMPNHFQAHINAGAVLIDLGSLDAAIEHFRKAICIKSDSAEAHNSLGVSLMKLGNLDVAIECYQKALLINPSYGEAYCNLGIAYKNQGELDAATDCYRKALLLKPDYADTYVNLGGLLMEQGQQEQALALYEKGLTLNPSYAQLHHSLIFSASRIYADNAEVFKLSKQFGEQFEAGLVRQPHRNDATPDRRIKVGYVSGDFREHSVAYFIEPILANHDSRNIETFCYYNNPHIDHVTRHLMSCAGHWRSIFGVSDENAAKLIRQDAIDILVDLSGHTALNRLLVFTHKPAPVQVTWMGYPASTGLSAMDYRLTSSYIDPLGWNEHYHTESLVRLSASTCFQPEKALPEINALPALKNGYLTFASFHAPNKITPVTISLWAKLLSALPTAKLMLAPDTAKDQIIRQFQAQGIPAERLDFFCNRPLPEYLALHNEIDIMLDTFPYNGGTVSRHSLWMGVPVLTLAGRQAVSRVGLALMTQLGLETFIAECEEDFVENARRWANDLDGLAQVRDALREKVRNAPFSKPAFVVNELEAAYKQMWRKWCEQQKQGFDE